ncbi:uncharacterized protein LAJ45_02609 [Morchella importuna]|uniref:uncharacterized protein n=1 Tax=Morchella importuna TaxID=1174673 RepID=UPI001E8E2A9E|nr:uncharacterized protein LAJ45_02609 [Morchella importuna]KAH8153022.1 hypothetical protein LAJ45_02609 [Morchella importuna]
MSATTTTTTTLPSPTLHLTSHPQNKNLTPLVSTNSLASYPHISSTPIIGTEFPSSVQLTSLLASDAFIRDLAILVSQRGVVFFRAQVITIEQQTELAARLGELSGKPDTSGLHVHPLTKEFSELGDRVSVISSEGKKVVASGESEERSARASNGWHADITFEKIPSDYAILKVHTLPETGGDTLWASAYEAYDRLSPAYQRFLEGLTATHNATRFNEAAARAGYKIRESRGAPENQGTDLTAVHPVIRTNPVTRWKGLFVNKGFTKRINELTKDESDNVLDYLFRHISENHDLQVRFKWGHYQDGAADVAIWDNRSVFHTATDDYLELGGIRAGDRVVSLGEKPTLVSGSKSRREVLGLPRFGGQQF